MKPPKATSCIQKGAGVMPVAVLSCLETLKKRRDFLTLSHARWQPTSGLILQAYNRKDDQLVIRVGFTCSKKLGNAVARNRAKRRLREIARNILQKHGRNGWDYVLIGKKHTTITREFQALLSDLKYALKKVHK